MLKKSEKDHAQLPTLFFNFGTPAALPLSVPAKDPIRLFAHYILYIPAITSHGFHIPYDLYESNKSPAEIK